MRPTDWTTKEGIDGMLSVFQMCAATSAGYMWSVGKYGFWIPTFIFVAGIGIIFARWHFCIKHIDN